MDTSSGHLKDGDENDAPNLGDMITTRVRDLLDESVGAQQPEPPGDERGTFLALLNGFGLAIEDRPQISIAEAADQELSMADGRQYCFVLGPGAQATHTASTPRLVLLHV